jgi:hypothetical protein
VENVVNLRLHGAVEDILAGCCEDLEGEQWNGQKLVIEEGSGAILLDGNRLDGVHGKRLHSQGSNLKPAG